MRDLRVRQKDQPFLTRNESRPCLYCHDLERIEPLSAESHDIDAHSQTTVFATELLDSLREFAAEERLVKHRGATVTERPAEPAHRNYGWGTRENLLPACSNKG